MTTELEKFACSQILDLDGTQEVADKFVLLMRFIEQNPDRHSIPIPKKGPQKGVPRFERCSEDHITWCAGKFVGGRRPRTIKAPKTIPDDMVGIILQESFDVAEEDVEKAKLSHSISMAAENVVGNLLERYIAFTLEPHGWIWCSGDMISAIDFIRLRDKPPNQWQSLQVKNRDTTENSSSMKVRNGTDIEMWHRTFSTKSETNWTAFPDCPGKENLSEDRFKEFVRDYCRKHKGE